MKQEWYSEREAGMLKADQEKTLIQHSAFLLHRYFSSSPQV
jgi:hypothetical protein